jgi:hypothetical protein
VLFTNEENGLHGGKAYAEAHDAELGLHVAAIESDSGGARPLGFGVSAGPGSTDIVTKLAAPLARFDADGVQDGGGGADIPRWPRLACRSWDCDRTARTTSTSTHDGGHHSTKSMPTTSR